MRALWILLAISIEVVVLICVYQGQVIEKQQTLIREMVKNHQCLLPKEGHGSNTP